MRSLDLRHRIAAVVLAVLLVLAACVPLMRGVPTGGALPGTLSSPGSLQVLAVALCVAALATTYDLLLGYTGLFSLGHALFFATGSYGFAMTLALTDAGFGVSVLVGLGVTLVMAVLVNAVALRTTAIAYSMVTLAIAQLASIVVGRNYWGTGGEEGITLPFEKLPSGFHGVVNTRNVYWTALALFVVVVTVVALLTRTRVGRLWQAIRENELRVSVMGVDVYLHKLGVAVISSLLAGACGIVYCIVLGTAEPSVTTLFFSLGLVVMVILGGKGRVWGAALGGVLYVLLEQRLPSLASSESVQGLPAWLRIPLSEPELLLGVVFVLFIFFVPGGLASLIVRLFERPKTRPVPRSATASTASREPVAGGERSR
ncbi:branched-chain amino acid ABC transporter permease [Pseudonocardia sp. RS010]|uniref:branched-chain amino acid ABC transporter permease n=1 Tax=Pseudonocardia sp. RS010 TaxID=3385979 RepID=UPI00399FEF06